MRFALLCSAAAVAKVLRQKNARISCLALHIYYLSSALKSVAPSPPPTLHFIRQAVVRGGRGGGKGHRGWSAAKVYPFFCALISIIDDATVHSIGKGKTTSTAAATALAAALATLAATAAAAARHKIKPKAIYVVALAR